MCMLQKERGYNVCLARVIDRLIFCLPFLRDSRQVLKRIDSFRAVVLSNFLNWIEIPKSTTTTHQNHRPLRWQKSTMTSEDTRDNGVHTVQHISPSDIRLL